ncbi:host-nuclease inhibitor Gam family protein [Akkermansia glycaniphila]|uniref:Bacteriophage mu gam like protein n=1 Tax=Akkermansia glycaniphila TaxID=1679444 RepID=A0A1C7PE27_9BACT|nr:host-nuclease inhibitor Gam family protein [Akkermansia glycaniphila]OCA02292.1 hypothetical protein AC781_10700 [Akkermansia glycaniphila]SEH87240.1 bacteriophage mu gam like protein [Akkermansia glycaniphila]
MTTTNTRNTGIADDQQFTDTVNRIARLNVRINSRTAEMDKAMQKAREPHEEKINRLTEDRDALIALAESYAVRHRARLIGLKKKSGSTELATFGFRTGKRRLELVKDNTWELVCTRLQSNGHDDCVRTVTEVQKDRVLSGLSPEEMIACGVVAAQAESFWVKAKDNAIDENN